MHFFLPLNPGSGSAADLLRRNLRVILRQPENLPQKTYGKAAITRQTFRIRPLMMRKAIYKEVGLHVGHTGGILAS
jgi:hypothetical protein